MKLRQQPNSWDNGILREVSILPTSQNAQYDLNEFSCNAKFFAVLFSERNFLFSIKVSHLPDYSITTKIEMKRKWFKSDYDCFSHSIENSQTV